MLRFVRTPLDVSVSGRRKSRQDHVTINGQRLQAVRVPGFMSYSFNNAPQPSGDGPDGESRCTSPSLVEVFVIARVGYVRTRRSR